MGNQQTPALPQLIMYKKQLIDLKDNIIPEGYILRCLQPGDEESWESIINASFKYESNFQKEIANSPYFAPDRMYFIFHGNRAVATATAWYNAKWTIDIGYLHMVGLLPEYAGEGLGMQVSLAALHQMKREERKSAVLHTDDFRIPAIKTYLKLGFEPLLTHESHGARWKKIFCEINKPELIEVYIAGKELYFANQT